MYAPLVGIMTLLLQATSGRGESSSSSSSKMMIPRTAKRSWRQRGGAQTLKRPRALWSITESNIFARKEELFIQEREGGEGSGDVRQKSSSSGGGRDRSKRSEGGGGGERSHDPVEPPTTPDLCGSTNNIIIQLQAIGVMVDTSVVPGNCELNSVEMQLFRHLTNTSIADIDTFLLQPGGTDAIQPLQSLMMLFQERLITTTAGASNNITVPSDRDFLTTLMIPDRNVDAVERQLQISFSTTDSDCLVQVLQVASGLLGLILEVLGMSSGRNVAQRVVKHILDVLLAGRNPSAAKRLLALPLVIPQIVEEQGIVGQASMVLFEVLWTISFDELMSSFRDSMTTFEWVEFGFTIALDITLIVAAGLSTGGVGSVAVTAARVAFITRRVLAALAFRDVARDWTAAQKSCMSTPEPTPAPIRTPMIEGWTSGVFGDPHLATFDGLRFDCQAVGEFTMVKSLNHPGGLVIQERFSKAAGSTVCSQASISTGVAIAEEQVSTIQISIPLVDANDDSDMDSSGLVASCPVDMYVDGERISLSHFRPNVDTTTTVPNVDVSVDPLTSIVIHYPLTGLRVTVHVRNAVETFGCHFRVQVFIPYDYIRQGETLVGLLGKPNLDSRDDWVDPNGQSLPGPANEHESFFGAAYDYCVSNWCIRDETDSIFTYRPGEESSFATSSAGGCDSSYASQALETEVANADADLAALCEGSLVCLIDGICGNFADATAALQDEADVVVSQSGLLFPFDPSNIVYSDFALSFSVPVPFGSHQIATARISQDGYVVLYSDSSSVTTNYYSSGEPVALIAAFWSEDALLSNLWREDHSIYSEVYLRFTQGTDDNNEDLELAQSVVRLVAETSGSATDFTATSAMVATWRRFQTSFDFTQEDQENTFQLVWVHGSAVLGGSSSTTAQESSWAILSYGRLEFSGLRATAGRNNGGDDAESWFLIQSDAERETLLSGTNCGRSGTYAFQIP